MSDLSEKALEDAIAQIKAISHDQGKRLRVKPTWVRPAVMEDIESTLEIFKLADRRRHE